MSIKLTDTQLVILTQAAQHPERAVTIPDRLRGGAVTKVVAPLLTKELVEEVTHRPGLPFYRTDQSAEAFSLRITRPGLEAIGMEVEPAEPAPAPKRSQRKGERPGAAATADTAASPRSGTKQDMLIAMLRRTEGATVEEVIAATGWQAHTVRGAMSGALKKRLELNVTSEKIEERRRVHRIPG